MAEVFAAAFTVQKFEDAHRKPKDGLRAPDGALHQVTWLDDGQAEDTSE